MDGGDEKMIELIKPALLSGEKLAEIREQAKRLTSPDPRRQAGIPV